MSAIEQLAANLNDAHKLPNNLREENKRKKPEITETQMLFFVSFRIIDAETCVTFEKYIPVSNGMENFAG